MSMRSMLPRLRGSACFWRRPLARFIRFTANRTISSAHGLGSPAARWSAAIDERYRSTVARDFVSVWASMNATTVSGLAGSMIRSTPEYHAEKMRLSAASARSVLSAKAPRAARA